MARKGDNFHIEKSLLIWGFFFRFRAQIPLSLEEAGSDSSGGPTLYVFDCWLSAQRSQPGSVRSSGKRVNQVDRLEDWVKT